MNEDERIALLARLFEPVTTRGVELGIGDDAAVLSPGATGLTGAGRLVWTIDEQVEGTHFRRAYTSWTDVGWRSFMAAASDVAAMGAEPWCALSALVLPDDVDDEAFEAIASGQRDAAAEVAAPIVGGNLARGAAVSITTTLLGGCDRPIGRGGARAGHKLWLAGQLGLAAAGLRGLEKGLERDPRVARALEVWRRPRALIRSSLAMAGCAHAAVDVSDGLSRDAGHVARASGVLLVLDGDLLVQDEDLARAADALGLSALDLALHGGEDYALLAASEVPIEGFRCIGEVREGSGLMLRTREGEWVLEARGYDHFDRRPA
jgi:thiamine-monophosphate kinase